MPTPAGIARDVYEDRGENLDIVQVLTPGGGVGTGQSFTGLFYGTAMAQDNITATPSGTQANSVQITTPMARITTVANANDGVVLPPALRGMEISVVNDAAANAAKVFATGSDTINGTAGSTGVTLVAQNGAGTGPTIYYCFSNGAWRTK
jgi:hypothetical protein